MVDFKLFICFSSLGVLDKNTLLFIFGGVLLKLEHLDKDLLIDYKVEKENIKHNYKNKEKKIKDSFSFEDLLTEEEIEQMLKYMSE